MKKLLFLIHDLGQGGAEKVLVNLVNNMDTEKFDITVMALFGGGVNEQFLKPHIRYQTVFSRSFPGNSHIMKLLTPQQLHKLFIKEKYDIEISYLEGPSARIISGCPYENTKLVSWIHVEQHTKERAAGSFRSYKESENCYYRFDKTICVSESVKNDFINSGATSALLSGSGSCIYGIYSSKEDIKKAYEFMKNKYNYNFYKCISYNNFKGDLR